MSHLLEVKNLTTAFTGDYGTTVSVDHVSFHVDEGEVVSIVGESGCGKSVTSLSIMGLLGRGGSVIDGSVLFDGKELLTMSEKELDQIRGNELTMIFQDPLTSLNPVFTIGSQMMESIRIHMHLSKKEAAVRAESLLARVGMPDPHAIMKKYPHTLSGGMRQRVMIAMALACNPRLLIADEPTTALDVTIQAQIMNLLKELQQDAVDSKEFLDNIKLELFSDTVFVFSPASEVYELPTGSTPLDFAYRVHTEIGNQCVGAKVNGKIVPFDYELQTGDTVEILRSKNSRGPNSNWLKLVKTPQAKNKIRSWLKKNKREENLHNGKEALERYVKAHHAGAEAILLNVDNINRITNKLGYKTADDLYVGIGVGGVSTMQVVNRMRDEFKSQLAELEAQDDEKTLENQLNAKSNRRSGKKNIGGISIQGMGDVDVKFANCCKPVPGDPIVGYITRGSGITVHHRECKNIQSLSDKDRARLIDVNWEGFENSVYEVQIFVEALDRPKITPDVMALINDSHVHIASITSRVKEHMALMEITAEVSDLQELNVVMEKINAIPDVFSVRRD